MISLLKVRFNIPLLILLFIPTLSFTWPGKVANVADGDNIKVLHNGQKVKIRLYCIDCPEKAQAYGQTARQIAAPMVTG